MSNASLELGGGNWAAKDGNLLGYAVGDTSGKYLPREFTFSRGADIAATRVNKDGLIEKYRENLLLQSNNFGTTWTSPVATINGGYAGYDGSNNAWLVTQTGTGGYVRQSVSNSGIITFSVYVKAGSTDWVSLEFESTSPNPRQYFQLTGAGVKGYDYGSSYGVVHAKIDFVSSGWYRISLTSSYAFSQVRIRPAVTDQDVSGTSDTIYIQDAQVEYGLVATDYLESGATTGKAGVLDNLPRIDYTSGSAQLLMEPSRTNYIDQSEYFGSWTESKSTVTLNDITSPDGLKNAYKLLADADGGSTVVHQIQSNTSTIASGAVSASVYAKKGNTDFVRLRLYGTTSSIRAWFDLSNGTTGSVDAGGTSSMTSMGDGWYRCTVTEAGNTNTSAGLQVFINESNGQTSWVADGDEYIYIYGAQLEAGKLATSYIPTYGAKNTRDFDDVNHFDTSVLGFGTTCSIYFEGVINEASGLYLRPVTMFGSGFDTSERFLLFGQQFSGGTYKLTSRHNSGGATNGVDKAGLTIGEKVKCVSVFDGTSQKFFVNGSSAGTDTVPAAEIFEYLDLSNIASDQSHTIESLQLYPVALSDAECIALTTL